MQEIKKVTVKVPQAYLDFMNQIFEIEKKAANLKEENSIQRNLNKMKGIKLTMMTMQITPCTR